jgi:hypothetical protein
MEPAMTTQSSTPQDRIAVLAPLTSNWGNGTNWAVAALVEIDGDLRARVAEAHALLTAHPYFECIEVNHPFLTLPGSDNDDRRKEGVTAEDEEQISAIEQEVWSGEFEPRPASADEVELFRRRDAFSVQSYRILVTRWTAPRLICAERYEGEEFQSPDIAALIPPAMQDEIDARSSWRNAA